MQIERLVISCLALLASTPALGQGGGGASCTLTATPLAFGTYAPSSGQPADFSATLTVTCVSSGSTPVPVKATIALSGGESGRRLTGGTRSLRYQVYLDPARTMPWGDGAGDGAVASVSGLVSSQAVLRQTFTLYGRILGRQNDARVGDYSDRITAILTY
jgi:spore coat protein U-like protein